MDDEPKGIDSLIRRLLNRMIFLDKRSVFCHGSLRLYPSEIHLMQVIKEGPGVNAGRIAQRLGVSNGAVSQTLARLERKGVINKTKDPSLKNELTVILTGAGKAALHGFEEEQAEAVHSFSAYLTSLSGNELKIIEAFLAHIEEFLKRLR